MPLQTKLVFSLKKGRSLVLPSVRPKRFVRGKTEELLFSASNKANIDKIKSEGQFEWKEVQFDPEAEKAKAQENSSINQVTSLSDAMKQFAKIFESLDPDAKQSFAAMMGATLSAPAAVQTEPEPAAGTFYQPVDDSAPGEDEDAAPGEDDETPPGDDENISLDLGELMNEALDSDELSEGSTPAKHGRRGKGR